MKLFFSPHNDDETLFGAFTIQREPDILVVVCLDSHVQVARGNAGCDWLARRGETVEAMKILRGPDAPRLNLRFLGLSDQTPFTDWRGEFPRCGDNLNRYLCTAITSLVDLLPGSSGAFPYAGVKHIYAPAIEETGHAHHNLVGTVVNYLFRGRVPITHYLTYTPAGKSTSRERVPVGPGMAAKKLQALACYTSQLDLDSTAPHFLREQYEYYQPIDPAASA